MNLDGHHDWRKRPSPFSFYSMLLLLVFVGASLFMAWAIVERPWGDISINFSTPSLERTFTDIETTAGLGEAVEGETAEGAEGEAAEGTGTEAAADAAEEA
jgi:hypothetical protein